MRTVTTIAEVRAWHQDRPGSLGLVPTMGYLHAGHRSLLEHARAENVSVAASVFVNPTQFAPGEDLSRYPRSLEADQALLGAAGCDLLFVPAPEEMYPPGFETAVEVGSVSVPLEGWRRPGHFRGVATVVLKLFGIFQPQRAYFGQKDAQQLAVIRRLVRDLDLPLTIVGCPIVREPGGLALSSRNSYLSPEERRAASFLYRALSAGAEAWGQGEHRGERLRGAMRRVLEEEPLAQTDYVSAADPVTFQEIETANGPVLLSLAVRIGRARLIDNRLLEP